MNTNWGQTANEDEIEPFQQADDGEAYANQMESKIKNIKLGINYELNNEKFQTQQEPDRIDLKFNQLVQN